MNLKKLNFNSQAFALTIPEPATMSLLVLGALGLMLAGSNPTLYAGTLRHYA